MSPFAASLPSGTVTFLFTDIEGSTRLWEEQADAMRVALARHDSLIRSAIESCAGVVFKTMGDAFFCVFPSAVQAVEAALLCQRNLVSQEFSVTKQKLDLKVRIGIHTGESERRGDDYYGPPLNRLSRLLGAGHGGQVLLTDSAFTLVRDDLPSGASLTSLGEHRLKDLGRAESVYQLCHPDIPSEFPPLRSLDNPDLKHNLPIQLTSFIGRGKEVREVRALFEKTRLLTLTGSGGCGKTRLALQAAAEMLDGSGDGVWLVELAAMSDPALVPQSVATVLGLKEQAGKIYQETLSDYLKSKYLLLVLDNCEHLLSACAELVESLLSHCPRVLILATSREALGIAGEAAYRVPSLGIPKTDSAPESLPQFESVQLFVERASLVSTGFGVNEQNAPAIASICRRLDGIPLAIELAASRIRSLSVEEVNQRLDQRFRLLTGGSRTALPRQQTLRSLIDWSYDLLSEQEQALFVRLSVFSGGWTLESAESVCSGEGMQEGEVLDLLTSLVDKSLVTADSGSESTRYRFLETVRQYSRDKLLAGGQGETWRNQHLEHFAALAEEAEPHLKGEEQQTWLDLLEAEHDNLRTALEWATCDPARAEHGLRLCGAAWRFWQIRGHFAEGRRWCLESLALSRTDDHTASRAKALAGAGILAYWQGDNAAARALHEESLAIRREIADRPGIASSLNDLGGVAWQQGDYQTARLLHEESLAIRRELNDRWGIAMTLSSLAHVAQEEGDYLSSRKLHEESLHVRRQLGDRVGVATSLTNLGNVLCEQGDLSTARALLEEGLEIQRKLGDRWGIAFSLANLGMLAYEQGDYPAAGALLRECLPAGREMGDLWGLAGLLEYLAAVAIAEDLPSHAARLWGAAERMREDIGSPLPPAAMARHERGVSTARVAVGNHSFDQAWAEGRAMTMELAVQYALAARDPETHGAPSQTE